tara:strand:- start:634 stop:777 length:144 start_codon:yes stop_codon:yes gene_type:complete
MLKTIKSLREKASQIEMPYFIYKRIKVVSLPSLVGPIHYLYSDEVRI